MLIPSKPTYGSQGSWAWPAGLVVWGPGHFAAGHAHHAVQLVLCVEGELHVRGNGRGRWRRSGAVIVRPDAAHEINPPSTTVLIAFVDPESALAKTMMAETKQGVTLMPPATVRRWRRQIGAPHAVTESRVRSWFIAEFGGAATAVALDRRVASVLRILRSSQADLGDTSLARLAAAARLSPSRFAHLFSASVGLPLRRYVLWLRLQRAIAAIATGDGVTEAAYVAGFSDAAHLSRTFRRMLGCPPSELVRRQRHVREISVDDARD